MESAWLDAVGHETFSIRTSDKSGNKTALVLPDIATCKECQREIFNPANRRFRYPFTNCTHCGPRFSLIEALPYDRANTTMRQFIQCPACQAEYDDPRDRRFHAQPNACPACGPHLEFWNPGGAALFGGDHALLAAAHALRRGKIVAVKGIGGFHLMVDARNENAVRRLRTRKHREEKPFAVLFPSLASVHSVCEVSPFEARLLVSPEAPIVLLRKKIARTENPCAAVAAAVAPDNPHLGAMLPANPLHYLLLAELNFPVVATSGNLSDEPICTDEHAALERLAGIADGLLVHNRPIVRHVDDSIVRVMLGREMVLRRARGYAPLPITLPTTEATTVLAVGAHLKNTVALAVGGNIFLSQHIGDLETEAAQQAFRRVTTDLQKLFAARPTIIAADLHPDYLSTQLAETATAPPNSPAKVSVQHHVAHVLSCLAENEVPLPALGVAWDGTGLGTDGTIWGGEFFRVTEKTVERVAHLRPFRLPGGDAAVKEPRRVALGLLYEMYGESVFARKDLPLLAAFSAGELKTLQAMLQRGLHSPWTTSVGRLFDGVAALIGLHLRMRFEGQAAMALEFAADEIITDEAYEFRLLATDAMPAPLANFTAKPKIVLDWQPLVAAVMADVQRGIHSGFICAKFHHALVEAVLGVAKIHRENRVALSGGCFQNHFLTERIVTRLRAEGFAPYWHQRVPTNDGGIALGQIVAARKKLFLP